jgi:hypothetical protein
MAFVFRSVANNMAHAFTLAFGSGKGASHPAKYFEEGIDSYHEGGLHPVRIGDIIWKYLVLRKLGYGQYSTVWLVRHLE